MADSIRLRLDQGPRAAFEFMKDIRPVDSRAMEGARRIQESLTKPRGSLGKLEDLSARLAGIYRTPRPQIRKKTIFTMAGDHGVTEEGISAYPSEVTSQMVLNFARGGAAINVLARHAGAEVVVVDMGVKSDQQWPGTVLSLKECRGTRNMAVGPAMSKGEATRAVETGAYLAIRAVELGTDAVALGDMGIGNTTAASAITAVIANKNAREVTGRGTGISDAILKLKAEVIEKAIRVNSPNPHDGLDVLTKVGGLEIAGLTGVILGSASKGVPVFIDGFVSCSAALVAASMAPTCKDYMIASHLSAEPGHAHALKHLELEPLLDLRMRLGEGTGAALAFQLAEASCKILSEMATFEGAGVSRSNKEAGR